MRTEDTSVDVSSEELDRHWAEFGKWIATERANLGITQQAAALRAGMTRQHWSEIERGTTGVRRKTAYRLASALRIPTTTVLERAGYPIQLKDHLQNLEPNREAAFHRMLSLPVDEQDWLEQMIYAVSRTVDERRTRDANLAADLHRRMQDRGDVEYIGEVLRTTRSIAALCEEVTVLLGRGLSHEGATKILLDYLEAWAGLTDNPLPGSKNLPIQKQLYIEKRRAMERFLMNSARGLPEDVYRELLEIANSEEFKEMRGVSRFKSLAREHGSEDDYAQLEEDMGHFPYPIEVDPKESTAAG